MTTFKRIMIGLDFSILDQYLISYIGFFSHLIKPDKIYFINIQKSLETSSQLWKDFPIYKIPRDEQLKQNMKAEVMQHFASAEHFDIDYIVTEGVPLKEIEHWIHIKGIDLLVVGQKKDIQGNGILPQQLVRKIDIPVLFVPKTWHQLLHEILLPIDFSPNSTTALQLALNLVHENPDVSIYCEHIYDIPKSYYFSEKGKRDIQQNLRNLYQEEYNHLIEPLNLNGYHLSPLLSLNGENGIVQTSLDTAKRKKVDLIIVGASGKSWWQRKILGSFTEKMLQINKEIPMLVIKTHEMNQKELDRASINQHKK